MNTTRPICLFTDYGLEGPYVGLVHAAIHAVDAGLRVVDVQHDAPRWQPGPGGRLLHALLPWLPADAVVVAVVDPGVGGARDGLIVSFDGRTLVGPDNGLFEPMFAEAGLIQRIDWQPPGMSASFHGRDWFAPVAARIAIGQTVAATALKAGACVRLGLDATRVIYIDGFGNLMTGIRSAQVGATASVVVAGRPLPRRRTFGGVPPGELLCYENSLGLLEIAVNQGSAAQRLGLGVGDQVTLA